MYPSERSMRFRTFIQLFFFGLFFFGGPFETAFSEEQSTNAIVSEYIPFSFDDRTLEEELEEGPLLRPTSKPFGSAISEEVTENDLDNTAPDPDSVLRPRYQMSEAQTRQQTDAEPLPVSIPQSKNDITSYGHYINNVHSGDETTCSGERFHHLGALKRGRGYCSACGLTTCSTKTFNRWFVDGWITLGTTMNFDRPEGGENALLRYNDRDGDVVMNQLYVSFGRNIDKRRNRFDFGGQIDLLYGTDYFATSSLNLETRDSRSSASSTTTLNPYDAVLHWNSNNGARRGGTAAVYGLSLPQAYAEVYVPFHFGTTLKAGHFYSGMSLESAMSPQNFFYSHSYSFMYGSPTTLTGIMATTQWTKRLSTVFGITQGWNVFDNPMDRVNYLGGVQWDSLDKETSMSFLVHTGKESERPGNIRTGYVLTLNQLLTKRLRYSLEHTLGFEDNAYRSGIEPSGQARWASVAQYLQWEVNDQWAVGLRGEWFRDDGYSRIVNRPENFSIFSVSGKDIFEVTFGVNWKPTRFITIRPELRYDWANTRVRYGETTEGIFNEKRDMFLFAIDAVVRF